MISSIQMLFENINYTSDIVIPPIFRNDVSVYDNYKSFSLFTLSEQTSSWSLDSHSVPVFSQDFIIQNEIKGWDKFALQYRRMGIIAYSDQQNIITGSFSGTVFKSQWIDDFNYAQVIVEEFGSSVPNDVAVHRGFYDFYKSMRVDFYKSIMSLYKNDTIILLTGHSLGGALATLFYVDLKAHGYQNVALYTYGAPRVGNIKFSHYLNQLGNCYRIMNTEDIVTNLPFPISGKWLYEQSCSPIDFTDNMGTVSLNHLEAYKEWLKSKINTDLYLIKNYNSQMCDICSFLSILITDWMENNVNIVEDELERYLDDICQYTQTFMKDDCKIFIDTWKDVIVYDIMNDMIKELPKFCYQIDIC
jgi:triacylglycerol lipase